MGSLMAGWDSHVRHLRYERNWSLTKEEIDNFWRLKRMEDEELFFLKASYKKDKRDEDDGNGGPLVKDEDSMEPLLKKHGWWISSKWAFLNEPPKKSLESSYNYVAQFHIARKHIDGITA